MKQRHFILSLEEGLADCLTATAWVTRRLELVFMIIIIKTIVCNLQLDCEQSLIFLWKVTARET